MKNRLVPILKIFTAAALVAEEPTALQFEFFEKKIRPVLAENCYECHNSIDKAKGDIALDYRAALLDSGTIVPGKPRESDFMLAIKHDPDYEPMPWKKPKLSNLSIKAFEDWIRMGAPDPRLKKPTKEELASQVDWNFVRDSRAKWWSFQEVAQPDPPRVGRLGWKSSDIDKFVYTKMAEAGLEPQRKAEPGTLLRRLYLVLIGVPPIPEEVLAFTKDPSEKAYAKEVDKLLASKEFGERWGRYWLDWFRYAETHGSEGDPTVPYASEYRDYIIRALNSDVPYDQLLKESIAGDLLEDPRVNQELGINESAIGPAHLRMVPHGFGVTDAYDEQITFTDNQIDVLTKATMGMTLSCSRCHNHKFDPLSQKDFYKFYGIMVSSRPGTINIDSPELQELHRKELLAMKPAIRKGFAKFWLKEADSAVEKLTKALPINADKKALPEGHPLHAISNLHGKDSKIVRAMWGQLSNRYNEQQEARKKKIAGATYYADLRDQGTYDQWYKDGTGLGEKVSPAGSFAVAGEGESALSGIYPRGIYSNMATDKDNASLTSPFHLAKGKSALFHASGLNSSGRIVVRNYPLAHGLLHPSMKLPSIPGWLANRKYPYWNGEQIYFHINTNPDSTFRPSKGRAWFGITEVYAGETALEADGNPVFTLPGDMPAVTNSESLVSFYRTGLQQALQAWEKDSVTDTQAVLLEAFRQQGFLRNEISKLPAGLKAKIDAYRKLEAEIRLPRRAPGVLESQPWEQPFLVQGNYRNEEEPVARGFLEVFGSREYSKHSSGRLELAEDLVSENNTLATRVIVNRLWHHTFGRGLVSSTDNFGRLGKPPSHPELLDHLATQFREDGWSIKKTLRKLVTSRTFQSSSQAPEGLSDKDPDNLYLTHYRPRRLDAEAIRDTIYHVSGASMKRSVYQPQRRNNLDPFLAAFNLPIPTSTVGVRDLTNVPAQSLVLMNGQVAINASNNWRNRILNDRSLKGDKERVETLFLQAFSRLPTPAETASCLTFLSGKPEDGGMAALLEQQSKAKDELSELEGKREKLLQPTKEKLQKQVDARNAKQKAEVGENVVDLKPLAQWDFEGNLEDSIGPLHGSIKGNAKVQDGALVLAGGCVFTKPLSKPLKAKTFEALVQPETLRQRGGGVFTVQTTNGSVFDSLVLGEMEAGKWMAGSNNFGRTLAFNAPLERGAVKTPVRLICVYRADGTILAYRNGQPYGKPIKKSGLVSYAPGSSQVVFGLRHGTNPAGNRAFRGKLHEARLYDRALTPEEVAAAGDGILLETLREDDVLAALPPKLRKQVDALAPKIQTTKSQLSKAERKIQQMESVRGNLNDQYGRLTHALINSKELIYVY